jgi:hypothetical protein
MNCSFQGMQGADALEAYRESLACRCCAQRQCPFRALTLSLWCKLCFLSTVHSVLLIVFELFPAIERSDL